MLDKAQLSAAKIILGCLKTTSSNDVLADLHLTSLNLRRKISLLCYVSKLIYDMVPCPFPASSFRSFKEFVPYGLRHNQNVQITLFKKSLSYNLFLRKASSLWNSLPLEIKSSSSHSIFMNRLNSHYHISRKSTHLLGLNPHMTSIRCMLRFAHSPLNITKNNYPFCICGEMEIELHLFFHCNVHCAARTALHNKVHDILNETGFAERFERLGHTDLLR